MSDAKKQQEADEQQQQQQKPADSERLLELGSKPPDAGPTDKMNLVFLLFVLHGIGVLLPWNTFINAKEYFEDFKLNTNSSREADYRVNFMNYVSLAAQLPNMLMSAFNVFFQPTAASQQSGSTIAKLIVVLTLEAIVCLLTSVLALVDSSQWPETFFSITMLCVVVLNCCTGVYQSCAFSMAALLPMAYSNAVVIGNNTCGTLIAVVNILCKLASAKDLQLTAVAYFTFSTLLLVACLTSLALLPKLKFYCHYQRAHTGTHIEMKFKPDDSKRDDRNLLDCAAEGSALNTTEGLEVSFVPDGKAAEQGFLRQNSQTAKECFALCCISNNSQQACRRYWWRYWVAFSESWVHCLSVWSVFFCTLSCFPAVQSNVKPLTLTAMGGWFTDIFVFLFFNAFAMLGNICSNFVQVPSPRWLWVAVWVRTGLCIPFFVLCNCFPSSRLPAVPVLVSNDYGFIVGMIAFAFTSGYFSSLCMMYAPRSVAKKEHAGLAAMVASFFLVFGIFCGVTFGTLLTKLITAA